MQAWQKQIAAAANVAWRGKGFEVLTGRVELRMMFFLAPSQITKSLPHGPDVTNLFKAAEDALKGIVFEDDRQSHGISASKVLDSRPDGLTIVWVRSLDESPESGQETC